MFYHGLTLRLVYSVTETIESEEAIHLTWIYLLSIIISSNLILKIAR